MEHELNHKSLITPVAIKATDGYYYRLRPEDVVYIVSDNNRVKVYLLSLSKPFYVYMTQKELLEHLRGCGLFVRVNRKVIVNKMLIVRYSHEEVGVNGGNGKLVTFTLTSGDVALAFHEIY